MYLTPRKLVQMLRLCEEGVLKHKTRNTKQRQAFQRGKYKRERLLEVGGGGGHCCCYSCLQDVNIS